MRMSLFSDKGNRKMVSAKDKIIRNTYIFRRGKRRKGSKWFKKWQIMWAWVIRLEVGRASGTKRAVLPRATE